MRETSTWKCPACGQKVTLYIKPSEPPFCGKHAKGGRVMQRIDDDSSRPETAE